MNRLYSYILLILILIPFSIKAQTTGSFDTTITFMSQSRTLSIFVPPGYNSSIEYRLMIGLHGLGDNSVNYRNVLINSFDWKTHFPNTIFIFPDGGNDQLKDFYAPAGDEAIIQEAIDLAKQIYSIDTTDIILQGFSLGGRSALKYGLDFSEKFKGLLLNTPAIQGWRDAINDPNAGVIYNYSNASEIPIYITVGGQDQLYAYILNNVMGLLKKNNAPVKFINIAGLGHTVPQQQHIIPSIAFFDDPAGADYDVDLFEIELDQRRCYTTAAPFVFVQNKGAAPVTSIEINYQLGADAGTYTWNGSLNSFDHTQISIPSLNGGYGTHNFTASIGIINGNQSDTVTENNSLSKEIMLVEEGVELNISEGFENNMADWVLEDTKTLFEWYIDTDVKKSGTASLAAFNTILLFYTEGNVESFQSPLLDLTSAGDPMLIYDIAFNYHRYTPPYFTTTTDFADTLEISVSTDCGSTFNSIYKKGGAELATATTPILNPLNLQQVWFNPTANQWRTDTLPLTAYANETEVIVRFSYHSAMGGSIYLDNISFQGDTNTGIKEIVSKADISIYPNPGSSFIYVKINDADVQSLTIFDITGKVVLQKSIENSNGRSSEILNVNNLPSGLYQLVLEGDEEKLVKKLVISR